MSINFRKLNANSCMLKNLYRFNGAIVGLISNPNKVANKKVVMVGQLSFGLITRIIYNY